MMDKYLKSPSERKLSGPYVPRGLDDDLYSLMNYGRVGLNNYNGRKILHEPMFMNALRLLICDLRPSHIIEFGTFEGGLTSFMSDVAASINSETRIISYDIDVIKIVQQINNAEIVQLDIHQIEQYLRQNHDMIVALTGPKIIIDDIGEDSARLLSVLDPYVNPGDYFVSCGTLNEELHRSLMDAAADEYAIDTYYCDMFGENFIENPNGFLVKTKK